MKVFTALKAKLLARRSKDGAEGQLCPLPHVLSLSQLRRVQVFAPHPDDESIGCGGLLALLAQQRCDIQVVLVSDGSGAGGLPPGASQIREQEFIRALGELGISNYRLLNFPDGDVQPNEFLKQSLTDCLADFLPDAVVMPSILDLHRDHRVIAEMLFGISNAFPSIQMLIQYEVWCPLPATHIVDITTVAERKWSAIRQHKTALACGNYLDASEGLARYRGLLLGFPGRYVMAEAYVVDIMDGPSLARRHWLSSTARKMLRLLASKT